MNAFNSAQLAALRKEYSDIKTINPDSPTFKRMQSFLDNLPQPLLKQLADAKIKFISGLALNRVKRPNSIKPAGAKRKAAPRKPASAVKKQHAKTSVAAIRKECVTSPSYHARVAAMLKKAKPRKNPAKKQRDLSRGYFIVKSVPAGYFEAQYSMAHFTLAQVKAAAEAKCKKYNCQARITEFWP